MDTAYSDCETAKTAQNTTDTAAAVTVAETALTNADTALTNATAELAKAQAAYDSAVNDYNANTTNADLIDAKDKTFTSLGEAQTLKDTVQTNYDYINLRLQYTKACNLTTVAQVKATEATTHRSEANTAKNRTENQESNALTAKNADNLSDIETAESVGTTRQNEASVAAASAATALTEVTSANSAITALLTANPSDSVLSAYSTEASTALTTATNASSNASDDSDEATLALLYITTYKYVLQAKAHRDTAATKETEALGHKDDAETYLAAVNTAKSVGDQSAADTAAANAATSATSATTSSTAAGTSATSARALADTVNTSSSANPVHANLSILYAEIDGYATAAETSATNAQGYATAAATASTNAQTAASASSVDYSGEVDTLKSTASGKKSEAETAETAAVVAVGNGDHSTAQSQATLAVNAAAEASTAATSAKAKLALAESVKNNALTSYNANTSDSALKTSYETALEDYNAARIGALETETLAALALAAAVNAQIQADSIASDQAAVTWDTSADYAKTQATAIETAASNSKDEASYFQTHTEDNLIALDTASAATSNSRASLAASASNDLKTAVDKVKTALDTLRTKYDAANSSNSTLTNMESTVAAAETSVLSSVTNTTTHQTEANLGKTNAQAAVDGNANTSSYSTTATSAYSSAKSEADTIEGYDTYVVSYHAIPSDTSIKTLLDLALPRVQTAQTQYMIARSAMRISEAIKTTAYTAHQANTSDSSLESTYQTKLEDFNGASLRAVEAYAEYSKAFAMTAKYLEHYNDVQTDQTTVTWTTSAKYIEDAAKVGELAASDAKDLAARFKAEVDVYVAAPDLSKANISNSRTASAATAAGVARTSTSTAATSLTSMKTSVDTVAAANSSNATLQTDASNVNTSLSNATTSQTNANTYKTSAETSKTDAQTAYSSARRILEATPVRLLDILGNTQIPYENNYTIDSQPHLQTGRVLSTCPSGKVCVNAWTEIDQDNFILESDFQTQHSKKGGCKFVCETTVNPKPTPTNVHATTANGWDNCYNSCSTADSLERCVNGECVKNCQISDPGLVINCNANEECQLGTGGADNTCVAKPCEPACDENYETCDSATNYCSLNARKPKITALTTCQKVENCDAKFHLDKCYQCQNLFSFKIDPTGNTASNPNAEEPALPENQVPECIQSNIPNALMASEYLDGGVTRYKVEKCAPGYILDFNNNECTSSISNCKLNSADGDCLGCDTPYETAAVQLVYGIFEKGFCKTWGEFTADEQTALTPPYQEHCKYYEYTYNSTDSAQVNSLKDGASVCYECDPDYYFATSGNERVCTHKRTANCLVYDSASTSGTCTQCEPGYKLVDQGGPTQACQGIVNSATKVPGCSIYDESLNCVACSSGYLFRATGVGSGQTGYCFQQFADSACEVQDEEVFSSTGQVQCQKCLKVKGIFYYPRKFNSPVNACMYLSARNLCVNHDFDRADSLALTNTFQCLLCEPDYYLKDGVCNKRINLDIRGCIEYDPNTDACKTYESSTAATTSSDEFTTESEDIQNLLLTPPDYLDEAMNIDFGGWILSCEVYKNETTCERCFAPKYLNPLGFEYNTKCLTASTVVQYCLAYSDASTCSECFPGYMLIGNECKLITVENCATHVDENTCGSCSESFPFLDQDGNCTLDPRNMFCQSYFFTAEAVNLQDSKTFECDTCLEGYFPDDFSICTLVENEIPNCKFYAGDSLCKECHEGFYLNFNGKNCFINPSFDPFCQTFTHLTECPVCERGYYVGEDGLCTPCDPDLFPLGCMYCDPDDNSSCLLCDFEYQMTSGGCVRDPSAGTLTEPFLRPFNYFIGQTKTPVTTEAGI